MIFTEKDVERIARIVCEALTGQNPDCRVITGPTPQALTPRGLLPVIYDGQVAPIWQTYTHMVRKVLKEVGEVV